MPVMFFLGFFFVFLEKFSGKNIVDFFLGGGKSWEHFFEYFCFSKWCRDLGGRGLTFDDMGGSKIGLFVMTSFLDSPLECTHWLEAKLQRVIQPQNQFHNYTLHQRSDWCWLGVFSLQVWCICIDDRLSLGFLLPDFQLIWSNFFDSLHFGYCPTIL